MPLPNNLTPEMLGNRCIARRCSVRPRKHRRSVQPLDLGRFAVQVSRYGLASAPRLRRPHEPAPGSVRPRSAGLIGRERRRAIAGTANQSMRPSAKHIWTRQPPSVSARNSHLLQRRYRLESVGLVLSVIPGRSTARRGEGLQPTYDAPAAGLSFMQATACSSTRLQWPKSSP